MRQLEVNISNKLKKDFPSEIEVLENGMDVLVRYSELLKAYIPYKKPSHTVEDVLKGSSGNRCLATQIMLIIHSIETLKASRLLLITGYIGPSMSCLRTSYEAFQNAHICSVLDEQAIRFLQGKYVNNTVKIPLPIQLEKAKGIKSALSDVGVHAIYKSLENQGYFSDSIFHSGRKRAYEFYFLRSLWSFFQIQLYILEYLGDKWPNLLNEIPNVVKVATDLNSMIIYTEGGFLRRAK